MQRIQLHEEDDLELVEDGVYNYSDLSKQINANRSSEIERLKLKAATSSPSEPERSVLQTIRDPLAFSLEERVRVPMPVRLPRHLHFMMPSMDEEEEEGEGEEEAYELANVSVPQDQERSSETGR